MSNQFWFKGEPDAKSYSIRSTLPLTAESLSAAMAFTEASRMADERKEAEVARLAYLTKCPVAIPGWPMATAADHERVQAKVTSLWQADVDAASNADLRAIAERFAPENVEESMRVRVVVSLAYAAYMNQLRDCPAAWWDPVYECVEDMHAEDARLYEEG